MYNLYNFFSLPAKAYLTPEAIEEKYLELMRAHKNNAAKEQEINQAFLRISDPVTRLQELFDFYNVSIAERELTVEKLAKFLDLQDEMQFMELEELEHYYHVVRAQMNGMLQDIDAHFEKGNVDSAQELALEIRYLSRFTSVLGDRIDELVT